MYYFYIPYIYDYNGQGAQIPVLKTFEGSTIMDQKIENLITEIHHNPIIIKVQARQLDDFWQSTSSEIIIQPLYLYATGEEKDEAYIEDLATIIKLHIDKANRHREERNMQAAACIRENTRCTFNLRKRLTCFDDNGVERLKELLKIAEAGNDKFFILVYKTIESAIGLQSYTCPHLFVCDLVEDHPYWQLVYSPKTNRWGKTIESDASKRTYQLSDIYDGLTVGNEFVFGARNHDNQTMTDREYYVRRINTIFGAEGIDCCEEFQLHMIKDDDIDYVVDSFNAKLKRIRTCHVCKKHFVLADTEIAWFEEKQFKLPNKCAHCRKEEKRKRRQAEYEQHYRELGFCPV